MGSLRPDLGRCVSWEMRAALSDESEKQRTDTNRRKYGSPMQTESEHHARTEGLKMMMMMMMQAFAGLVLPSSRGTWKTMWGEGDDDKEWALCFPRWKSTFFSVSSPLVSSSTNDDEIHEE
ncbi:cytochrome b [Anopheles sinensis]|uniref:Cytochrome b n=1 Tax=Anopheles sinensis TaxID=74873 RepID=A0A084VLX0_ANOSI|nr:cytochrome b [Anopheles sinensis]